MDGRDEPGHDGKKARSSLAMTVALFRAIGPKRTRLVAQIVAAVIGAAFVIGLQIAAILSYGTVSLSPLQSAWLVAHVPDAGSPIWWPARAVLGDPAVLLLVVAISLALLGLAIGSVGQNPPGANAPGSPKTKTLPATVRDDLLDCLRSAACAWSAGDPNHPRAEQVWDQLWSILEEAGVLKSARR